MQPTYLRHITEDEKNNLYDIMDNDVEADYRAEIVLLRSEGYTVAEIRRQTNHHDNNIRKWIHRFNSHGIDGIVSRRHNHTAQKITDDIEKEIVLIASTNPRKLGLKFSTWSLRVLVGYVMEKRIANSISHTEIRNVLPTSALARAGASFMPSPTIMTACFFCLSPSFFCFLTISSIIETLLLLHQRWKQSQFMFIL